MAVEPSDALARKTSASSLPDARAGTDDEAEDERRLSCVAEHKETARIGSQRQQGSTVPVVEVVAAYTNAQTEVEVEQALRTARAAVQDPDLGPPEKDLLRSLLPECSKARKKEGAAPLAAGAGGKKGAPMSNATVPLGASVFTPRERERERAAPVSTLGQSGPSLAVRGTSMRSSSSRRAVPSSSASPTAVQQQASWDDEKVGDEEMASFARRAEAKKRKAGASQDEIEAMLEPPACEPPGRALSRRQAEVIYGPHLTAYEVREMAEYETYYYCGQNAAKFAPSLDPSNNFGFDDERGDYKAVSRDHLAYRYEVMDLLGRGSFGQVLRCKDHKTGQWVAIKLIRNKKRFHQQALIEVDILRHLNEWDPDQKHNLICMAQSFYFREHLCIATELLNINLYELVKANGFSGLSLRLVRRITTQCLAALSILRRHHVVHCDLKPENVLLCHPARSAIKVIDFGSSCLENERVYTYIQSRFYRSPEVILGLTYGLAIDMWSLGCIVAELYTGYPLFPGENEQEQLACIMEVLGVPDKHLIERAGRRKFFFDAAGSPRPVRTSKNRKRKPASKTLAQLLSTGGRQGGPDGAGSHTATKPADEDLFIDFVARCLIWDPERRLRPDQAMRHPWIAAGKRQSLVTSTIASSTSAPTAQPAPALAPALAPAAAAPTAASAGALAPLSRRPAAVRTRSLRTTAA